ncbi:MAG: tripartite tricarboxylate transporter substrate binding protein, partial [Betaproteobacteria bacterium]|nr:tripartite tricarboxylate transporter substrate binding protein [Betaproteobacteria bacterium]
MQKKAQVLAGFVLSIAAAWFACAPAAFAQAKYPVKPIRILIPFPAGGAADTIGRTLG